MVNCDMLVIGAGPSGLYAAYYAGFRGFSVTVLDVLAEPGGQISAMYPEKDIYDIAGFAKVKGRDLVSGLLDQANQFSPKYVLGERAESLETSEEGPVTVITDKGTVITAKAVVITGGIGSFTPRELPAGNEFIGRGLVYFVPRLEEHRDKDVVIVGGGDSAFDWALSLHGIAKSITIVHRRDTFRAHAATVEQVKALGVTIYTNCEVSSVSGTDWVTGVTLTAKETGEETLLPADTIVAALGFIANIGPISQWGLNLEKRRILVDTTMQTNLPRVYAAGDITTYKGKVALISVGFGEAGLAVNNATPYIDESQGIFPGHSTGSAES
ncbi:MAG: NAD(P)/FAD-dependent oxidoreductase [Actinobacteria bacterium]|nr:NAD(P)/FAD-dependent oxidoreductase [Actinomycetota bacterium]